MGFQWLRDNPPSHERPTRVPLVIYVLWHPAFADGPRLAREIAEWCGGATTDIRASGMGLPVFFRSEPWTGELALEDADVPDAMPRGADARLRALNVWRRPIELGDCTHNVFVPLVDDNMVDDPSWRRDLITLARRHREDAEGLERARRKHVHTELPVQVHLAPIQVTSAWARLPTVVSGIQTLFLRRWDDDVEEDDEERVARWRTRIRRLLTQAIVRLLRETSRSLLPTQVFLSHAKADGDLGPGVAERIRDIAAGYGQVEVFYDENDLPSGTIWENSMLGAAATGAGFIAVLSDAYASRYWCRREVQLARTPERLDALHGLGGNLAEKYVWRVRPTVVTVTMDGKWSRLLGDVASVPAIRWRGEDEVPTAILDQVFREALISEFQVRYAKMLHAHLQQLGPDQPLAYVTWTLDPTTFLRLAARLRKRFRDGGLLVYPGHGLLPTEEQEFTTALGENVVFMSFERFSDLVVAPKQTWNQLIRRVTPQATSEIAMADRPIVALSVGDSDNLAALGYDTLESGKSLHVDSAVLRICRTLLQGQARLAYGGVLRQEPSLTSLVHDIIVAMASMGGPVQAKPGFDPDPPTPLECWVSRFYEDRFPLKDRAAHVGMCRYNFIGDPAPVDATPQQLAVARSRALSAMRSALAKRTRMTFALAGKRWGFEGIMPGVAEEILVRWEQGGELSLLLGEYGGVVAEIVRYIIGRADEPHPCLTLAGQLARKDARFDALMSVPELKREAKARYQALSRCMRALRKVAEQDGDVRLPIGLTVAEWRHVMTTSSVGYVRRLLREKVLPALFEGTPDKPTKKRRRKA